MRHRAWLRALVCAVVAAAVILIAVQLSGTPYAFEDFEVYRRAAWDVRHGVSVYVTHTGELTYEYSPWLALAMVPLTWLPLRATAVVWALLVVASVVVATWLSAELAGLHAWRPRYAVLVLAFLPLLWAEVVQGQVNAMIMASALAGVVALSRNQEGSSVAFFAASALIKPHGLIFLPWLALRHRRAGVTATTIVLLRGRGSRSLLANSATASTPASRSRAASASHSARSMIAPKGRAGTAWPSTRLVASHPHSSGARWATNWWP